MLMIVASVAATTPIPQAICTEVRSLPERAMIAPVLFFWKKLRSRVRTWLSRRQRRSVSRRREKKDQRPPGKAEPGNGNRQQENDDAVVQQPGLVDGAGTDGIHRPFDHPRDDQLQGVNAEQGDQPQGQTAIMAAEVRADQRQGTAGGGDLAAVDKHDWWLGDWRGRKLMGRCCIPVLKRGTL